MFYYNRPVLVDLDPKFHSNSPLVLIDLKDGCNTIIKFKDGSKYSGQVKNFKFQGEGDLELPNGDSYSGKWLNGMKHGTGILREGNK
jgi:hypothetical protein